MVLTDRQADRRKLKLLVVISRSYKTCFSIETRDFFFLMTTIFSPCSILGRRRKNSNKNYHASPVFLSHFHFPVYFTLEKKEELRNWKNKNESRWCREVELALRKVGDGGTLESMRVAEDLLALPERMEIGWR